MFRQNNVYVSTEYGTRECPEDREPCGAFYGIPFSGEIEDMPIDEREQVRAAMPERWFSKKDERVLATMRGELPMEIRRTKWQTFEMIKDQKDRRCAELVCDFKIECSAPVDIQAEYEYLVRQYVEGGKNYLLNEILDIYARWYKKR